MDCPKCKSRRHVKDGIVCGRQRHMCKECHYHYTVERKSDIKTVDRKRLSFALYLEGFSYRAIGQLLNISYGTVYVWMKGWISKEVFPRRESPAESVALEKMLVFIESKKADRRYGLLLTDLETGLSIVSVDKTK